MTAVDFTAMPRGTRRRRKDREYVPAELRASERLAHLAALEVSAEYDAQGIDAAVVTYRERGECLVMVDGKIVATTVGLTDEAPVIETCMATFREEIRRATMELEKEAAR